MIVNRDIFKRPLEETREATVTEDIDQVDARLLEIANREEALEKDTEVTDEAANNALRYKQRAMDTRRVQAKALRHSNRLDSINEALLGSLLDNVHKTMMSVPEPVGIPGVVNGSIGILQLSDMHLNEVILLAETNYKNEYNMDIAAKRLTKYVYEAIDQFKTKGIKRVLVALTGDILNNDTILDKAINNEESKAAAILVASDLIYQAICELTNHGFKVTLATVIGNESRLSEYAFSKKAAINNADTLVHYILQAKLQDSISYVPLADGIASLVAANGANILFTHGDKTATKGKDPSKAFDKLLRLYPDMTYLISGHIHETLIGARFARSGSLCGNNAYSQGLCLTAPASQNIHIVDTTGAITSIAINLQNTDSIVDYFKVPELSCMVGQHASQAKLNSTYKLN